MNKSDIHVQTLYYEYIMIKTMNFHVVVSNSTPFSVMGYLCTVSWHSADDEPGEWSHCLPV